MKKTKSTWLKNRGYIHVSPQIDVNVKKEEIIRKVKDVDFISKHAFYPLLHSIIKERRFKIIDEVSGTRSHSINGQQTSKLRPLHYATHIDALIFGYYAEMLQREYEYLLSKNLTLSDCITAYRKIKDPLNPGKFKSTINFAHEVFEEISKRSGSDCVVLKFDIKSFFSSIDHKILKNAWSKLLSNNTLPKDHYNVYKATTKFSYILKDDLRICNKAKGRKSGFDEKNLSYIRKSGKVCFFESNSEFREKIKDGSLKVYKYPFRHKVSGEPMGIPQGLPISAILANLYLLDFDKKIVNEIVLKEGGFYRRYSDDIVIICNPNLADEIQDKVIAFIKESNVLISKEKTEKFFFKRVYSQTNQSTISSFKASGQSLINRYPFTYLGFEFNGEQILIKSSNLAKFYRRMITSVKRKAQRAVILSKKTPGKSIVVYRNQLIRLYSNISLDRIKVIDRRKTLVKTKYGYSIYQSNPITKKFKSNYFSYVRRSSIIMKQPCIENQLLKHKSMFNRAISLQIKKQMAKEARI